MGPASRISLALGLLCVLLATADAWGGTEDERVCEERRASFYEAVVAQRDNGPEARHILLERLQTLKSLYGETAPVCLGRLQEHTAFLYVMDERYDEMEGWIARYLEGSGVNTSVRSQIMLHNHRGYALRQLGRTLEGAQATFRAASFADRAEAVHGARALITAGYVARDLGEEGAAMEYFESALRLIADSLKSDPALLDQQGSALTSLSILTDQQIQRAGSDAERDSLIDLLDRRTSAALAVLSSEGQAAGHRAHVANLSALVAAWRGDTDLARDRMRSSRMLAERAGILMPLALWNTYITEGRIAELSGDLEGARAAYERAREEAIRTKQTPNEADALEYLGRLDEREGDWTAAAAAYQAAIDRREIVRDRLGLGDWSASAFARMQAPYRGLTRVRLAQGDAAGAFKVLDRTRARYLQDLRRHHHVRESLKPESRRAVDSVASLLSTARLEVLSAGSVAERAALQEVVSVLQQKIESLTSPNTSEDKTETVDIEALQRILADEDRTLISYMIGDEEGVAFVVRPDTLIAVSIPATTRRVREHLRAIGSPWNGRPPDLAFSLPPLHALYRDLMEPLRRWVPTSRVTIIPDGVLTTAPFAIFLMAPAEDYENAPYLLRDWTLTTDLAAALVAAPAPRTDRELDLLVLGRSTFAMERSTWNEAELVDLPNVHREVSRVGGHGKTRVLEEEEATEARFQEEVGDARIIHLASHAQTRPELPLYSRIMLHEGSGQDGVLHLYEILNTPLRADLVVLSGCSTADGGKQDGEGLVGLQYGMRAAGSDATLATLWPVADRATADLMESFYDGLETGLGKDEALRQAQLAYLENHDGLAASPFYWAAPVLSGSPSPVSFHPQTPWAWLIFGVAGVAGVAGGLAWRFRPTLANA